MSDVYNMSSTYVLFGRVVLGYTLRCHERANKRNIFLGRAPRTRRRVSLIRLVVLDVYESLTTTSLPVAENMYDASVVDPGIIVGFVLD